MSDTPPNQPATSSMLESLLSSSSESSNSTVYAMESWLDVIFAQSHLLAIVVDIEGTCQYLSSNCQDITGYGQDSLHGSNLDEFVHKDDLAALPFAEMAESQMASTPTGEAPPAMHTTELRLRHADKKWHWHQVELIPTHGLALTGPFLLLCRDVTRSKLLEHRVEQARVSADIARRSRTQFLSHVHHEFRTPLNAIIGFAEMMRAELFGPIGNQRYMQYLEHIRESSTELMGIIDNTLELASLTSGETRLSLKQVDARTLIKNVVEHCQTYATQNNVTIQERLPSSPLLVRVDDEKVEQALQHVLHNAIKFSEAYSKVSISSVCTPEHTCRISIIDQGEGMSERKVRAVLKPFSVEDVTVTDKMRGAGLGLTLAKEFISLHDGCLNIDSEKGKGTTVSIDLPLSPAANDDMREEAHMLA